MNSNFLLGTNLETREHMYLSKMYSARQDLACFAPPGPAPYQSTVTLNFRASTRYFSLPQSP